MEAPVAFLTSFKEYISGGGRMLVLGNSALLIFITLLIYDF
jgi:hypothetical protein